jgi:hypothetical protein
MYHDAGSSGMSWRDQLWLGNRPLEDPEEVASRASRKKCARPATSDGGQIARLEARGCVSDPENPAMNADQRAVPETPVDLSSRDPGLKQLSAGDNAVRARCKTAELSLDRVPFGSHTDP